MRKIAGKLRATLSAVAVILLSASSVVGQGNYVTENGHASFFSKAPISDVDADNRNVAVSLDPKTGELSIDIDMINFIFENKKMGRDAEEKYIEIEKFPKASFRGKVSGKIDYDKPGTYPATAVGQLTIHGVEKQIREKGTVIVLKSRRVKLQSEFHVTLKDYNIDTPSILGKEMTEDHVLVKFDAILSEQPMDAASKK